uniref:Mitochondrial inner membrane protein Mpv17 n=1 Tax=Crassostrea virginica TaxID=6565 RepID=A0A8B8ASB0_CRAVI|nr:protein Mpv17-like [Crassostrea virginica]
MNIFLRLHSKFMQKSPWTTVAFSTGLVMSTGDAISQKFVEKKERIDRKRYLRYWAFGVIIAGPLFHGWYLRLQKIFGHTKFAPFKMVVVDQMLFAPAFPPFFLGVMGLMKGDSFPVIKQKIQQDYTDILTSCWSLWPGVQFFNFLFVPLSHRVLFNNVVALGWDTYLAWKADSRQRDSPEPRVLSPELSAVSLPSLTEGPASPLALSMAI